MARDQPSAASVAGLQVRRAGYPTGNRALGAAVGLFLAGGATRVVLAVLTPILFDPRAGRVMFLSAGADTAFYGAPPADLIAADPTLVGVRWTIVMALCGALVGLGLLELGVAWFGLRAGQRWALAALATAGFAVLPFWWLVVEPYAAAGVAVGLADIPPFMTLPALLLLPAVIAGSIGLRRERGF